MAAAKIQQAENTHHNRKFENLRNDAKSPMLHSYDGKHPTKPLVAASRRDVRVRVAIITWMCCATVSSSFSFQACLASDL